METDAEPEATALDTNNMSIRSPAGNNRSRSTLPPGMQYFLGIDYHNLQKLCNIRGLQSRDNPQTTPEAHHLFLQLYGSIFIQPKPVLPKIPELRVSKLQKKSHVSEVVKDDHVYRKKLVDKKDLGDIPLHLKKKVKMLIRILKKLPFHRTRSDYLSTYKILKMFPAISTQFTDQQLKRLNGRIIMESWDRGYTVSGNQAFYLILKGCARPYMVLGDSMQLEYVDPLLDSTPKMLSCGDSFGSLVPIPNQKSNRSVISVFTEDNCEILKISTGQYEHVKMDIMLDNHIVKEELIQACPFYQQWPRLSLNELVELIQWKNFPENYGLGPVNQMLLQQTAEPVLGNLTQEEVNNRYIFLEKKREWKQFKQKMIRETMLDKGIKPGIGKWKHNWNEKEHSKGNASQSF
ncbi:cyclic nucleotide-binding domain-containing protein 1 isoform X2 [Heterodontus francisci]|uniref:cyclic nucleotide-binding domain-containing protein 1 isoform X2 n=1 Tax=Heterodontus francisci TaxID=7792 RepID=UPI00355B7930